jgi:ribosomal protein S18 acetylase RimI-like enzyme
MGIVLREARAEELATVAKVMSAAYEEYVPPGAPPDSPWREYLEEVADPWSRLADSTLIVAEDAGEILGAVTFYPKGYPDANFPPGWAGIRLLAVDPGARGRGLGRELTAECIRRAHEQGSIAVGLHTTRWMAVAQAMYERMGFVRTPEHDLHPAEDVLVMAYRLEIGT